MGRAANKMRVFIFDMLKPLLAAPGTKTVDANCGTQPHSRSHNPGMPWFEK